MRPHLLFDKSFLQQLTVDESVWLDAFFRTVITPTFYTETLADLSKSTRAGRSPEDEVRIIADKTPTMHSAPVLGHVNLCMAELRGSEIPVDGAQIPTLGGRPVASEGKRGVVFRPAAETEAFRRWQRERFYEIERDFAIDWRRTIQELDLAAVASAVQKMGLYRERAGSLQAAYEIARSAVDAFDSFNRNFRLLALFLGVEPNVMREAARAARRTSIRKFSMVYPYCAHVLTVELFFQIAVASGLIAASRPSNRVDISYLFYLPFCQVFVSSDRLHRSAATPFETPSRRFVWGQDLKDELRRLNAHYLALPEPEKARGAFALASRPPSDDGLVARLWDLVSTGWREPRTPSLTVEATAPELWRQVQAATKSTPLTGAAASFDVDSADFVIVERLVPERKGSWCQVRRHASESDT